MREKLQEDSLIDERSIRGRGRIELLLALPLLFSPFSPTDFFLLLHSFFCFLSCSLPLSHTLPSHQSLLCRLSLFAAVRAEPDHAMPHGSMSPSTTLWLVRSESVSSRLTVIASLERQRLPCGWRAIRVALDHRHDPQCVLSPTFRVEQRLPAELVTPASTASRWQNLLPRVGHCFFVSSPADEAAFIPYGDVNAVMSL